MSVSNTFWNFGSVLSKLHFNEAAPQENDAYRVVVFRNSAASIGFASARDKRSKKAVHRLHPWGCCPTSWLNGRLHQHCNLLSSWKILRLPQLNENQDKIAVHCANL